MEEHDFLIFGKMASLWTKPLQPRIRVMRIFLFLLTNAAVLLLISILFHLFGLGQYFYNHGLSINFENLLLSSAVIGMSGSFISLMMSKWMAKQSMGVYVIGSPSNQTESWLVETVSRQAKKLGIGMPEVGIFQAHEPNAFATGMSRDNALVAVSTGLLERMRPEEVEAVLGHEMSHVANGDMVTMGLLQGVVNTFVYFLASVAGFIVDRALARSDDNRGGVGPAYYIVQMISQLVLSILATMIVMGFSRWREFRADEGGARLAGKDGMINALRALQRAQNPEDLPGELAAFGISGGTGSLGHLFLSHPPLEERIRALQALK
jgi:heat shock protein HtpX